MRERTRPELRGSSRIWILGEFALFSVTWEPAAEEVPVARGSCAPRERGGVSGEEGGGYRASGRLKAENGAVAVPLWGHGPEGTRRRGWTLPKGLRRAAPSATGGLKMKPGCVFFSTMRQATL